MDDQRTNRKGGASLVPQFRLMTVLIAVTVIAAWLSTFNGYAGGEHVRHTIMLAILLASLFSAIYGRARRRAFWMGFFAVMLLSSLHPTIMRYFDYLSIFFVPDNWMRAWGVDFRSRGGPAIHDTIHDGFCLILASLSGILAVHIYNRNNLQE